MEKHLDMIDYPGYDIVMKKIDIHEARARFSRYIEEVERGEIVVVCRRNRPVAEIRSLAARRDKPRPIGLAKGKFRVPKSFFEDLPEETLGS